MLGQNDGDRRLIRWASLPAVVLVTVLYVFLSTAYVRVTQSLVSSWATSTTVSPSDKIHAGSGPSDFFA